jgi:hypothetical protein
MNYEWVNSDGEAISVRRFYAMLAWFLLPFVVAMFTGCQPIAKPSPEPQAPRAAWVITEVHQPAPPKAKTIACECVDCACDPCQCQPKSPSAVPVPDVADPKQHPRYDKSLGCIVPEGYVKLSEQKPISKPPARKEQESSEPVTRYWYEYQKDGTAIMREETVEPTPRFMRRLRGRWRGGGVSSGASAASC